MDNLKIKTQEKPIKKMKTKMFVYNVDSELVLHVATEAFQGALNAMCISQASTIHTYIQLYTHTHRHTSNEIVKVVVMVRVVQSNTTRFAQHCTVDRPDCHADDIDSIFASLLTHIFAS